MKKIFLLSSICIVTIGIGLTIVLPARANILDDILSAVKKPFAAQTPTITTDISLAPKGDLTGSGKIEGGNIIRVTFTLTNDTEKSFQKLKLKPNITRDEIHFVHNLIGVQELIDTKKDIELFVSLKPREVKIISFDAKLNQDAPKDSTLGTEAELLEQGKTLVKDTKKEITLKKRLRLPRMRIFKPNAADMKLWERMKEKKL